MAIGGTVDVAGLLSWTRGEFSPGSSTDIFEGTSSSFTTAAYVGSVPSSTTSRSFTKTIDQGGTLTRYYWVRHRLATGTLGSLVGPVTGTYSGLQ